MNTGAPGNTNEHRKDEKVKLQEVDFKQLLDNMSDCINQDETLRESIQTFKVSNVVATALLDVTSIDLTYIAKNFPFCHYHRSTFAAMGVRLSKPWSALLLYPKGMMVSMGTTTALSALHACHKFVQILNEIIKIPCAIAGFRVDNYVCSTYTCPLDLDRCVKDEWAREIEYDKIKFPGATLRCEHASLPFHTDVVMELFKQGKINITGAKSVYEAKYIFVLIYKKYIANVKSDNAQYKRAGTNNRAVAINTKLITPLVIPNVVALKEFAAAGAGSASRTTNTLYDADHDDDDDDRDHLRHKRTRTSADITANIRQMGQMADF